MMLVKEKNANLKAIILRIEDKFVIFVGSEPCVNTTQEIVFATFYNCFICTSTMLISFLRLMYRRNSFLFSQ